MTTKRKPKLAKWKAGCPVSIEEMHELFIDYDIDHIYEEVFQWLINKNIKTYLCKVPSDKNEIVSIDVFFNFGGNDYRFEIFKIMEENNKAYYKAGPWWDDIKEIMAILQEKQDDAYHKYLQLRKLKPFA